MSWECPDPLRIDANLNSFIDAYRDNYLRFFLERFQSDHRPGYRGGYFNINSVTGKPHAHRCCFSWTDGRSLAELSICHLLALGDREVTREYAQHIRDALVERWELNGYLPHVVDDATNRATGDPLNVKIGPDGSSYSHMFVMNGLLQHDLIFTDAEAGEVGKTLFESLRDALARDRFIEADAPRPAGERAQGPFMIALGAMADILETLAVCHQPSSPEFQAAARPFVDLGNECVSHILANHHRAQDDAFWEVSRGGEPVPDEVGRVVTDPGHAIEFTAFAARFAVFLPEGERRSLRETARGIFLWAAGNGFHPHRDLVRKNIDRNTLRAIPNDCVEDIADRVSDAVAREHFGRQTEPTRLVTYPWWALMELLAAGAVLRHVGPPDDVDALVLRAARGIFNYFPNDAIDGLCYQNIGDGFFDYIDIPPATPTLDLMHSHRSMRLFLREMDGA